MPTQRPSLVSGELYHVYNRGVEKRIIFPTDNDYRRFISALRFFNTARPVTLREFFIFEKTGIGSLYPEEPLVQIGSFILMTNHYHLLVKQLVDKGLSLFMQKLGAGYTGFFNLKHSRSGALFQGRYKIKWIDNDRYGRYIQAYIPLNALDGVTHEWREAGIKDKKKSLAILKSHPWSSFSSYTDQNKFPGIINPSFIYHFFEDINEFQNFVLSWSADDLKEI